MTDPIKGIRVNPSSGQAYTYFFTVRPGGKEIWSAHVYRDSHLLCVLARGLVDRELRSADLVEHVRHLVLKHIDTLP
ncbi:MAG TPA: hypothetical protein VF169_09245 [Albitalea sp.]|uniref:hypothetical protein n=1 Tax=Piscinibacter sp. TaxID=1903157 RepID=UPI002ED39CB3